MVKRELVKREMVKKEKDAKFIEILDSYTNYPNFQYSDLLNILKLSHQHYNTTHDSIDIHSPYYQAQIQPISNANKPPALNIGQNTPLSVNYQPYYQLYDASKWNLSGATWIDPASLFNQYTAPNTNISCSGCILCTPNTISHTELHVPPPTLSVPAPTLTLDPIVKTKKCEINVSINHFSDLLKILAENEYQADTEYNIDLEALVKIKTELVDLDKMVGISKFKDAVLDQILYFIQNLHVGKEPDFMHTILCGPPGTGKTEIAKILGRMYSKIGILKNGVFKKATRNDMVAGYLGQTAIKTKKLITECLGGCLFIDEAYSLASGINDSGDSYSKECLDTLCESLSDHKGELMVIIAGYEAELNETFFAVNRGLKSRFIWRFALEDYSAKELMDIFIKKVRENEWTVEFLDSTSTNDNTNSKSKENIKWFEKKKDNFKHFGRDMELLFSYSKIAHGRRIYGKPAELRKKLSLEDLDAGYSTFLANLNKKEERTEIYGLYV